MGCGDYGSGPHYTYRVFEDGVQVYDSVNERNPVDSQVDFYELVRVPASSAAVNLTFLVLDHFSGLFGRGETQCNITAEETSHTIQYSLGHAQLIDTTGSGTSPARLVAYVSDTTLGEVRPPALVLQGQATSHSASVAWTDYAVPDATKAEFIDSLTGKVLTNQPPNARGSYEWSCLASNRTYEVELRALGSGFAVGSGRLRFSTPVGPECPPEPPTAAAPNSTPTVDSPPTPSNPGSPSATEATTPMPAPLPAPVLELTTPNPGVIDITWSQEDSQRIASYRADLELNGNPIRNWHEDPHARFIEATNLAPAREYGVRLTAIGTDGATSDAYQLIRTTEVPGGASPGASHAVPGPSILALIVAGGAAIGIATRSDNRKEARDPRKSKKR